MYRFGSREVCDVVLRAKAKMTMGNRTFYKGEPVLYFDTLKTASLEGSATTVYAQGGRGNPRLIAWEGDKALTMTFEDALLSPESFSILAGANLIDASESAPIYVHTTAQVEAEEDGTVFVKGYACYDPDYTEKLGGKISGIEVAEAKKSGADVYCMVLDDAGLVGVEPCVPGEMKYVAEHTFKDGTKGPATQIACDGNGKEGAELVVKAGDIVLVDYYVSKKAGQQIEITADKFGGNFYFEGSTLYRRESDGVDLAAEIVIPNGKIQSNFTLAMANSGDPSTFSFVMDAFPDYTKFDRTHKVLAIMQVIDEDSSEDAGYREACDRKIAGE